MSIQSEINRILHFRDQSFEEVRNKGVTVPQDAIIDDLPDYIAQIQTGSGGAGAISIVDTPDAAGGTVRTITAVDISNDTVTAAHLETGYTAHDASGNAITGTLSPGGGGVSPQQVRFIDYDGSILYAYTAQEAQALSSLPANPSHSGLVAQGWNWTLQQIKAQLTAMPDGDVWVGQMYITQSGDTEIDVSMPEGRLSPVLTIAVNGTVTVDWGDNTTADTVTGTSLTVDKSPSHTYTAAGDYTIVIHVVSGSFAFHCDATSYYPLLRKNATGTQNRVYGKCVQAVRLGNGITEIGAYTFQYCYNLTSVTIPSTVTSIGTSAFYGCYTLSSITIPSGVTSISPTVFSACYGLTSVTIPSGVTNIWNTAFSGCYSLTSVTIPSTVTSIGTNAFQNCQLLSSITIPSGVTRIETYAFLNCYNLASITIPSTVTGIGANAFQGCYTLSSITIPSGVTSIANRVFSGCSSLTSVTIPSGVTSIGEYAFATCYNLTSVTIPSTLLSIGNNAFQSCYNLTSITIPSGVTSIGNYAFSSCSSLTSIMIPSTVTSIGPYAFQGCLNLGDVTIPSGVTSIASYAFQNCQVLSSVTIPSGVTSIGTYAFQNCYGMAELHVKPTTVPTLGAANSLNGIPPDCIIYVPSAQLADYQSASNWSTYASYMQGE